MKLFNIYRAENNELLSTNLTYDEVDYLIQVKKWPLDKLNIVEIKVTP